MGGEDPIVAALHEGAPIKYETAYEIPEFGYYQRAHTVVSYIFESGRWLATLDQGTLLELRPSS
ncbi:MAG: hypothetical protein H0U09_06750 [Geodermatophilaceae bacterium]|nr:hypothetical protein [Geodermatophilaceae bacterium]